MVGEWNMNIEHWQGKTKSLGEGTVPVPFCPKQISYGLAWDRIQISGVRTRLIFWALAWADSRLLRTLHTRVQSQGHVKSVVNKRASGAVFSSYCLIFSCQPFTNAPHRSVTRGKYGRPHCLEALSPHELTSRSNRWKDNSCSAILSVPRTLWDPKFQFRV